MCYFRHSFDCPQGKLPITGYAQRTQNKVICYVQNVRGLRTKLSELRKTLAVTIHRHDVIVLTETWLYDGISDPELGSTVYIVYRCDRLSKTSVYERGGGVLIAISKHLDSSYIDISNTSLEQLYVKICL